MFTYVCVYVNVTTRDVLCCVNLCSVQHGLVRGPTRMAAGFFPQRR